MKYALLFLLISTFGSLYKLHEAKNLADSNTKTIIDLQDQVNKYKDDEIKRNKDLIEAQDKANQVSADYEQLKAERAKAAEKNRSELQTIVTRTVYSRTCIDNDGLQLTQNQIATGNAEIARKSGSSMPGTTESD